MWWNVILSQEYCKLYLVVKSLSKLYERDSILFT